MNEMRYYLGVMLGAMEPQPDAELEPFKPTYLVTAVKLPTGAIELAVNTDNIADKMKYILEAYDDDMRLKTNTDIVMQQIMVV